ncbi:hypothetical protein H311_02011 [Anncaliia algerae PRA109]|nr:hypothetical protein H311_02011 [Anncaliia algerae PRA109]
MIYCEMKLDQIFQSPISSTLISNYKCSWLNPFYNNPLKSISAMIDDFHKKTSLCIYVDSSNNPWTHDDPTHKVIRFAELALNISTTCPGPPIISFDSSLVMT